MNSCILAMTLYMPDRGDIAHTSARPRRRFGPDVCLHALPFSRHVIFTSARIFCVFADCASAISLICVMSTYFIPDAQVMTAMPITSLLWLSGRSGARVKCRRSIARLIPLSAAASFSYRGAAISPDVRRAVHDALRGSFYGFKSPQPRCRDIILALFRPAGARVRGFPAPAPSGILDRWPPR